MIIRIIIIIIRFPLPGGTKTFLTNFKLQYIHETLLAILYKLLTADLILIQVSQHSIITEQGECYNGLSK